MSPERSRYLYFRGKYGFPKDRDIYVPLDTKVLSIMTVS